LNDGTDFDPEHQPEITQLLEPVSSLPPVAATSAIEWHNADKAVNSFKLPCKLHTDAEHANTVKVCQLKACASMLERDHLLSCS
jgi:hypothetical protein